MSEPINVNDWNTGWMVERDLDYYLVHNPMSVKTDGSPRFRTRQQVNKVLRSVTTSETPVYTYDDIAKIANELGVQIWGS